MVKTKSNVDVASAATSQRRIRPILATTMVAGLGFGAAFALVPLIPREADGRATRGEGTAQAAASVDHLTRQTVVIQPSAHSRPDLSTVELTLQERQRLMSSLAEEFDLANPGPGIRVELVTSSRRGLVEIHALQTSTQVDWRIDSNGAWTSHRLTRETKASDSLKLARGAVVGSFYMSAIEAGATPAVAGEAIKALAERSDLNRDLAEGGQFILGYQSDPLTGHSSARFVRVIASNGEALQLFRFKNGQGSWKWVDAEGHGGGQAMLRTPVDATRISSGFGMRRHPLLGYSRMHQGIDFAAPTGTAVVAAGDGIVSEAGWSGGYGRVIQIRHAAGWSSQYGHLSALSVARGQTVHQGQLIGRVGSTGLSTGPHLHFELRQAGKPVDPARQSSLYRPQQSIDPRQIAILRTQLSAAVRSQPDI